MPEPTWLVPVVLSRECYSTPREALAKYGVAVADALAGALSPTSTMASMTLEQVEALGGEVQDRRAPLNEVLLVLLHDPGRSRYFAGLGFIELALQTQADADAMLTRLRRADPTRDWCILLHRAPLPLGLLTSLERSQ